MRSFNTKINKNVLNGLKENNNNSLLNDEITNRAVKTASEILDIFRVNNCTLEEAYLILVSLIDSIYFYSTFKDDL